MPRSLSKKKIRLNGGILGTLLQILAASKSTPLVLMGSEPSIYSTGVDTVAQLSQDLGLEKWVWGGRRVLRSHPGVIIV